MSANDLSSLEWLKIAYEKMLRIRLFEERVVTLVNTNDIPGITHEYIGQEAVAVGVLGELDSRDRLTSTHRGHGHAIARGISTYAMFSELMARVTGPNRGRGGSMHVADFTKGHLGANGIVGASTPIACGSAFALKRLGEGGIVATFFGDGGINQGVVMESINLAAVWDLPVLFVCENNGYAISTPIELTTRAPIVDRVAAFGVRSHSCDGMDVREVAKMTAAVVEDIRSTGRPGFLECKTYRFSGHHTAEVMQGLEYREDAEINRWRLRDPLAAAKKTLADADQQVWLDEIMVSVGCEIEEAVELALGDPSPDGSDARLYMYASGLQPEASK